MKGLILKDFYSLRGSVKQMMIIYVFYVICAFIGIWDISLFVGLATMMGAMMVVSTFSYDDLAKWEAFALTMPIKRKDLVTSKYIVMLVTMFASAAFSMAIGIGFQTVQERLDLPTLLITCGSVMAVAVFGFCIQLMITFKFGVEKARLTLMAIFLIPTIFLIGGSKLLTSMGIEIDFGAIESRLPLVAGIVLLLIVVVSTLSYLGAIRIVEKREY